MKVSLVYQFNIFQVNGWRESSACVSVLNTIEIQHLCVYCTCGAFYFIASSTTDNRPPRKLSADPNDWTIDDVVQYISEVDSSLATHSEAFRKHVSKSWKVSCLYSKWFTMGNVLIQLWWNLVWRLQMINDLKFFLPKNTSMFSGTIDH